MNSAIPLPVPQGCTNLKLRQLTRKVARLYDAELGQTGLRSTQYSLLSCIVKQGPLRPADLAALLGLDPSTLTRNLKPLVAQGWVTQGAGVDARSRSIAATPEGAAKRAQAQRHWKAAQRSVNALLGDPRVVELHALLDQCMVLLGDD